MPVDEEEFTELVDGHFPRVDLVGKAANGVPRFLVAKGAAGTFEADVVRDLVEKAEMSGKAINDLPDSAFAYIEPGGKKDEEGKTTPRDLRHFPIHDESHTRNALSRAPQSPFGDKAMPKIREAAKKFGIEVAKAGELDASEALADEPDVYDEPGSQEWEQLDADTAMKWVGILQRAKNAIELLMGREEEELFAGEGDEGHVFDLEDACCAVQCAIDSLAPFAAGEQAEAELADEIAKAAWVLKNSTTIGTIEELAPIRKAGRTLSAQNETRIREAVESLQTVLSTLPEPVAKAEDEEATEEEVAKEGAELHTTPHFVAGNQVTSDVNSEGIAHGDDEDNRDLEVTATSNTTDRSGEADAVGEGSGVLKASGDPMMAVYTSSGKLLGAVDPSKITQLQDGDGDDTTEDEEEAPEAPPEDLTPAPSGTVGMAPAAPGAVAKSTDEVIKEAVDEAVKAALDVKDAEHASVVKALEDRLAALEAPAPSRVLSNGALPPQHMLRGMTETSAPVDVAKAAELHARWESASDEVSRANIAKEMNEEAARAWQQMRESRYNPSTAS